MADSLGNRLVAARRRAKLTQKQAGDAAGITGQAVSDFERDLYRPRDEVLDQLALAYGVTPAALRYGPAGDEPGGSTERVLSAPADRPVPRVARSHAVRVWLRRFLLELRRAGASEDQITEAEDILTAPELYTWYKGGRPAELTEQEALVEMEATAEVIWRRLERRGLKRPR